MLASDFFNMFTLSVKKSIKNDTRDLKIALDSISIILCDNYQKYFYCETDFENTKKVENVTFSRKTPLSEANVIVFIAIIIITTLQI